MSRLALSRCPSASLAFALLLSACGGEGGEGEPFRVAYFAPGSPAEAAAARQGLDLALAELNAEESAAPVEVVPVQGADCAGVASADSIHAVIGHLAGDALSACLGSLAPGGIPYLSAARLPADVCHASFHQVAAAPNQLAEAAAALGAAEGARRYYLLGADDPWTRALFASLTALVDSSGASVAGATHLAAEADAGAAVAAAAASGADLVVTAAGAERTVALLTALRGDARTRSLRVMTLGAGEADARQAGAAAEGVLAVSDYFEALQAPPSQAFVAALQGEHGAEAHPSSASAATYDALHLLGAASRSASEADTAALPARLAASRHVGPRGPISFSPDAPGYPRITVYLGRMRADGSVQLETSRPNVEPRTRCG